MNKLNVTVNIISVYFTGSKPYREVNVNATDDDESLSEAAVIDIQWDPNSVDYVLVLTYQCSLIMVDTSWYVLLYL